MQKPIRVLVIDDSAFMRRIIGEFLAEDDEIDVIGTARDGIDGVEKALLLEPDVVTLDIEMPRLDGYGALRELMKRKPMPVVMVSSHTQTGAEATIRALALGAVDFMAKPIGVLGVDVQAFADELKQRVRAAYGARPRPRMLLAEMPPLRSERKEAAAGPVRQVAAKRLIVVGSSTGGPGALHQIVPRLPANLPAAVLVVQHMPAGFTTSLANRLQELSAVQVREASHGDALLEGQVLVAPGGKQMLVGVDGRIHLTEDPPVHGVRPAVDPTLESAATVYGSRVLGVILTGMGTDGVRGVSVLKAAGGVAVAEHASTCVVYGMPRAVVEQGLADRVLPVQEIAAAMIAHAQGEFASGRAMGS